MPKNVEYQVKNRIFSENLKKPKKGPPKTNQRLLGQGLNDSEQLRRQGLLRPPPARTNFELESSEKEFDFGTVKKPSTGSSLGSFGKDSEQARRR